jgi:hypothetical protein
VDLPGVQRRAHAGSAPIRPVADRLDVDMIRLQWNALRIGHQVLVHDESDPEMPLVPGRVAMIQTTNGSNDVAIRISPDDGTTSIVRPRRLAVHLRRLDPAEHCWRCATDTNVKRRLHPDARATAADDTSTTERNEHA